ncbi:MAG: hypothetical protein D6753_03575 [Planctomycetota bacterium]|nr:MAG: hypothetical protein D6753_03575 [Planctomycetota bacterium]
MERGLAQIDLFSGVSLVVEGAAEFAVLSPMEVVVQSGRVRARVPQPAHGFRITTDVGEVVDLGTEFAVDVSDGKSEVHVLDGEVEWRPRGGQAQRVLGGQAVGRSDTGDSIEAPTREFVGIEQLRDLVRDARSNRLAEWREKSRLYRDDPRMLLYYQVMPEDVAGRRIPNLAGQGAASDGAVVAAMPSPDRWGQPAGAIDFSPAGSRVRVTVPGVHRSLTLLCWVKINSLDRWYNSLFLTDGHEQGEPHWQIMDDGRLFFSVKKRDVFDLSKGERDKHIYYSPPFWTPELSGRWLMIATVYDPDAMQVTHYLNGEVLSTEAIPQEYLVEEVRIGNASLCNWGLPERNQPRFAVRNLNGSLDEFMLFGAALSAEEIQQIYEFSRP